MDQLPKLPTFKSEAEEADWWANNQGFVLELFKKASAEGRVRRGPLAPTGRIPTTTIRLDPADISRARIQAEKRGLKYQTYLKMLVHEALQREEKAAS